MNPTSRSRSAYGTSEFVLAIDHTIRRMAYTVTEGQRRPLTHQDAAFQVFADGENSRLVWLTGVLPHDALSSA